MGRKTTINTYAESTAKHRSQMPVERNTQKTFQMEVANNEGYCCYYQCTEDDTVMDLKVKINQEHHVPVDYLHICFMEQELQDEDKLQTEAWGTVQMVVVDPYPDHIN